jgi:hypothetical protein
VFAVGGFWASFSWWKAGWGSLAVIGFALLAVFVKPTTVAAPVEAAPVEGQPAGAAVAHVAA